MFFPAAVRPADDVAPHNTYLQKELQHAPAAPDGDDPGSSVVKLTVDEPARASGVRSSLHSTRLVARSSAVLTRSEGLDLLLGCLHKTCGAAA